MSLDFYVKNEIDSEENEEYFNITHNLATMAENCGLYIPLWHPEKINAKYCKDIIIILEKGINELKENPKKYKKFNPENGWGSYEGLLNISNEILDYCKNNPEGIISSCG